MRKTQWLASTAVLTMVLGASAVSAQATSTGVASASAAPTDASDTNRVQEVVVTAEKRAENIQNVPLSIRAVTGETLENAGVTNPVDLQKLVPSLQVNNGLFSAGVTIRIRGFGSAANTTTDSDVASYMDGAYIPRPGAILGSFLDVKNVEVLDGPQGTLFGRNAALGAISINSNDPSFHGRTLEVKAEGGSYGSYGGTAVGNLPVSDTFAVRLAVTGSHTDGDYNNLLDGKTYGERNVYVGRLSTKWEITPKLSWIVRLDGSRTDGDGAYPPTVDVGTASAASLAALAAVNTRFGGSPQIYSSDPSYTFNQFINNPNLQDRQWGVISDLNYSVSPNLNVRLIDTYRDWTDKQLVGDTIATSLDLLSVQTNFNSKAQSHELQFITPKGAFLNGHLGFTSGLYYFHERYRIDTSFPLGPQFCPVIFTLVGRPALIGGCEAGPQSPGGYFSIDQVTDSYAGYAQANIQVVPKLELDAGVRETHDKKTAEFGTVVLNPLGVGSLIAAEGPEALSFSDTRPSFRASLTYHVADRTILFGTFSTGYKSGGFNSGGTAPALTPALRTFASETVDDYELGEKSVLLDGRLLINTTLFYTKVDNFQDRSFNGTSFLVRNSGNVRSRGVDFDGQLHVAGGFSVTSAITYLDSIYLSDPNAPGLEGCTGLAGSCPTVQNLSGRTLDYSPKWHGNVGLHYKSHPFMGGYTGTFSVTENFISSFLTVNTDNPQSRVPGYDTSDFRVALTPPSNRWQLEVFGTNVFDKHYYVSTVAQVLGAQLGVNNAATGATLFRGFLGDPARFGGRLSVKF
jgi:iron complex outermembrane receptor protein